MREEVKTKKLTQSEFIKFYCENSGRQENEFNNLGIFALPCKCGESECQGWVMVCEGEVINHLRLYYLEKQEKNEHP